MEAASAVAQAVRSEMLSLGDHTVHRKDSTRVPEEEAAFLGWCHRLPECEQEALVELARISVDECRQEDRADHAALDEYHKVHRCLC